MQDAEYRILDALYFPEPFSRIVEETGLPAALVGAALRQMLHWRWVQAMVYNTSQRRWEVARAYDADDLSGYGFQATHRGIEAHQKGM